MRRSSFENWPCSIARTVDILGDGWTLLVLREVFYGQSHFDGFINALGIARNTLADRLKRLEQAGVLHRRAYQTEPVRYEYLPTEKGRELFSVLAALNSWGDRWLTGAEGAPVTVHHRSCGREVRAEVVCAECGEPLRHEETSVQPGPGFPPRLLEDPVVRARFGIE